jgi:hypothetical protein
MSAVVPVLTRPRPINWTLAAGLAIAAAIAWHWPFDPLFDAITLGSPALRAVSIVAMSLMGLVVGKRLGMGFEPKDLQHPIALPIAVAAASAVGCALTDWLLIPDRHGGVVQMIVSTPLSLRLAYFLLRVVNENIEYRLFLGSVLIWLIARVWKTAEGRPAEGAYWLGFLLAQCLNVWMNVTAKEPITALALLHAALRYVAPAMVLAWLYRRHGFQSNEIACTTFHLFYQPLVPLGFR